MLERVQRIVVDEDADRPLPRQQVRTMLYGTNKIFERCTVWVYWLQNTQPGVRIRQVRSVKNLFSV